MLVFILYIYLVKYLFKSFVYFEIYFFNCLIPRDICMFWFKVFYQTCVLYLLSYCLWLVFFFPILLLVSVCRAEHFNFNKFNFPMFSFTDYALGIVFKKSSPNPRSSSFSPLFSSRSFIVLSFTVRSVIHFQITFIKL